MCFKKTAPLSKRGSTDVPKNISITNRITPNQKKGDAHKPLKNRLPLQQYILTELKISKEKKSPNQPPPKRAFKPKDTETL